jgi:hypothetical protein
LVFARRRRREKEEEDGKKKKEKETLKPRSLLTDLTKKPSGSFLP